eukprot:6853440-Alexandrium_andersonii.AAC.1
MGALSRAAACWGLVRTGDWTWRWPTGECADLFATSVEDLPALNHATRAAWRMYHFNQRLQH